MRISDWSSDVCSSDLFDADWREVPQDGRDGARRLREPGHFFEWAWLLHRLALLTGDAGAAAAMRPLYDRAWEKGVDRGSEAPFVAFEALDPDGRVLAGGSKRDRKSTRLNSSP